MNEILEALKAKYPGVGEIILKVKANSMHKKGLAASSVESTTWDEVILAYGDDRATQAAKTALEKAKSPDKGDEQGKGGEPDKTAPVGEVPAWAQFLIDQNKTFASELAGLKGEKVTVARRSQIDSLVQGLPEKLRSPYKRISVDAMTDEEFTAMQAELKTEIDGIVAEAKANGAAFAVPPGSPGGAAVTEATAEQAADLIKNM